MGNINKNYNILNDGINTMFKEFFNRKTYKKQIANMLTFSRLVVAFIIPILAVISLLTSSHMISIAAVALTIGGTITDFFDGKCARKYNSNSDFGKVLDIVADKIFSLMIGISLSLFYPLFLINVAEEVAIGITNMLYTNKYDKLDTKSNIFGKFKQWPLAGTFILGFLHIIFNNLDIILNTAITMTATIQLMTLYTYINSYNNEIKNYMQAKESNINNENDKIDKITKTKTLNKTTESNKNELKEQYIKLRNVLMEIIKQNNKEELNYNYKMKLRQLNDKNSHQIN